MTSQKEKHKNKTKQKQIQESKSSNFKKRMMFYHDVFTFETRNHPLVLCNSENIPLQVKEN